MRIPIKILIKKRGSSARSDMTVGVWRGKELVESLGEIGEFVSFSTTVTDAEEFGMYAECGQVASEAGGSKRDGWIGGLMD